MGYPPFSLFNKNVIVQIKIENVNIWLDNVAGVRYIKDEGEVSGEMNIKNLVGYIEENGNELRNYRHLCEVLEIKPKTSNSKNRQLREMGQHFKLTKGKGYRLIVDEVYETAKKHPNRMYPDKFYIAKPTIFMIKNLANSKKYVGYTTQKLVDFIGRFKGNYLVVNPLLKKDVEKYGMKNFKFKAVEYDIPHKKINKKRKFYINKFNTIEDGYNIRENYFYSERSGARDEAEKLHSFISINDSQYYVYRFLDDHSNTLYVGCTSQLSARIDQHTSQGHLGDEAYNNVSRIEYQIFSSKAEMDIMELYYINKWKPKYNTQNKSNETMMLRIENNVEWRPYKHKKFSKDLVVDVCDIEEHQQTLQEFQLGGRTQ